jgi:SAM-dependent methyltransferase
MTALVDLRLRDIRGSHLAEGSHRWLPDAERADLRVLDGARGAVLDIGCGPGRHAAELARRGHPALGIDITPRALDIARRRGALVMLRSVFDRIPATGRWQTALLLDGNIGIGGDPCALLLRVGALLAADGIVLAELAPPGTGRPVQRVRLEVDGELGPVFRWARVAYDRIDTVANAAGFVVTERWSSATRWFARLERAFAP